MFSVCHKRIYNGLFDKNSIVCWKYVAKGVQFHLNLHAYGILFLTSVVLETNWFEVGSLLFYLRPTIQVTQKKIKDV